MSVNRPCSTSTRTTEPIPNPCSSSHRPDMRRYGTTAEDGEIAGIIPQSIVFEVV